jgi:hypothetical protein
MLRTCGGLDWKAESTRKWLRDRAMLDNLVEDTTGGFHVVSGGLPEHGKRRMWHWLGPWRNGRHGAELMPSARPRLGSPSPR